VGFRETGLHILIASIYKTEVLHHKNWIFFLLQALLNLRSHSAGFIAELWLHLRNTVGDKTLRSTPSTLQICSFLLVWL